MYETNGRRLRRKIATRRREGGTRVSLILFVSKCFCFFFFFTNRNLTFLATLQTRNRSQRNLTLRHFRATASKWNYLAIGCKIKRAVLSTTSATWLPRTSILGLARCLVDVHVTAGLNHNAFFVSLADRVMWELGRCGCRCSRTWHARAWRHIRYSWLDYKNKQNFCGIL